MIECYKQAVEDFKRVDHLFHVSLKYTRTVDVIRSVIERIVGTFENSIDALLKCMGEEKEILDFPENPVGKANLVKEKIDNKEIIDNIDMYLRLRRLLRAEYTKREEFRRHVTMVTQFEGAVVDVDIDLLEVYYYDTKKFLTYIKSRVECHKE